MCMCVGGGWGCIGRMCFGNVSCVGSASIFEHDDVIKWKHFPRYWPFVRGIHRLPVNSPHKDQWRGALMFALICDWINSWVNNSEAGDFRRHCAHYDVMIHINTKFRIICERFILPYLLIHSSNQLAQIGTVPVIDNHFEKFGLSTDQNILYFVNPARQPMYHAYLTVWIPVRNKIVEKNIVHVNLADNCRLKLDFQKVDYDIGCKWVTHGARDFKINLFSIR